MENIEIKSRYYGASVLFSIAIGSLKLALEAAVKSGANLRGASLRGADLYGANLRGANLRGADLYGADLGGANLRGASLRGADLYGADLYDADLYGADLYDADLYGAELYGADLGGSRAVIDGGYPDGFKAFAWWKKDELLVSVGCRTKTIQQARDYWQSKNNRREIMAFLDYAEAVAKVRRPRQTCSRLARRCSAPPRV